MEGRKAGKASQAHPMPPEADVTRRLTGSAQRPKASSVGPLPILEKIGNLRRRVLDARRRHRLVHNPKISFGKEVHPARRPKASSSRPLGRLAWPAHLDNPLNARRRHRLEHRVPPDRSRRSRALLDARRRHRLEHQSTFLYQSIPLKSAQRPKASSSRTPATRGVPTAPGSAAQRPKASSSRTHRPGPFDPRPAGACSTPEGVIVSNTPSEPWTERRWGLLNARRRHRLEHDRLAGRGRYHAILLNARRRHRLEHLGGGDRHGRPSGCSTPEGVIVSNTGPGAGGRADHRLLNARRRHRLEHRVARRRAQHAWDLLNARRRHRLEHRRRRRGRRPDRRLLNARRRHRLEHDEKIGPWTQYGYCSTPEGVIVSNTSPRSTSRRPRWAAQRPKASSSRTRGSGRGGRGRGRPAQRPKASSSRTRRRHPRRDRRQRLLNARRRHRLEHRLHAVAGLGSDLCSTPEGVIVSNTARSQVFAS